MDDIPEVFHVDPICALVKEDALRFLRNGSVDPTCKAVRHRWVWVTADGRVDRACSAVTTGDVTFVSQRDAQVAYKRWKWRAQLKSMVAQLDWKELWLPPIFFVNPISDLTERGTLRFLSNGLVDETSPAVRHGLVVLDSEGYIDSASPAVQNGRLVLRTEKDVRRL